VEVSNYLFKRPRSISTSGLLFLLSNFFFVSVSGWAGIPVSEDGAQLTLIQDLQALTTKIQSDQALIQEHLARIRAMEEGSKAVALAMAQMNSLVNHGQLLTQNQNGQNQSTSANGLQYNGQNFIGGNYQFIDNIMGQNGPIALDRMLPTTLVPLAGGLVQQAQQSVSNFANSAPSSLLSATMSSLMGNLSQNGGSSVSNVASQAIGQLLQGSSGSISSGMMGDGVFLRPYAGVIDDAYQALVENGTPTQITQFFSDANLGGSGYNTILGSTNNPNLTMVNMDNVLSAGASQAVQSYLQSNSSTGSNPYQGYANQLLPQLASMISQAVPGTQLIPTAQQIASAQQNSSSSNTPSSFPSLFSGNLASTASSNANPLFGSLSSSTNDYSQQAVAAVTLPAAQAQAYQRRIAESDQKLIEITQELNTQQQAQQYTQQILQSLTQIHQQAQGIQQQLNSVDPNSIPELTTMIRDVQGDVESRQHDLSTLSLNIEKLNQELHTEILNRANYVDQIKKEESVHAIPRWSAAMIN